MLLPVQVTFRNMDRHSGLDDYVQKEAAKLERFYNRISSCRVMVERAQKAASSKLYHVRIYLGVPNGELVVKHLPSLHGTLKDTQETKSRREAVSVLAHKTPKRAIHEAFEEMARRLQEYARRQNGSVKVKQRMQDATVREIFPAEGYGFLETPGGHAVYFHEASVLDGRFAQLRTGARVAYDEEMGDKGPQATTVKTIHPRKQARSAALVEELPARQK
ncbi:MAG TPA: HPF/RaiA family ribosome-associated protein [Bryobacteraceae bacterium]|nr:HPF/RaiA family ribosome-associated protein [Bryobacteraceae bacterium]